MTSVDLPTLVIVAGASAPAIEQLFGKRGFVTYVAGSAEELVKLFQGQGRLSPAAAILDFELPDADQGLNILIRANPRKPVLVGIASSDGLLIGENLLDSAFMRPVDPARLFARVVQLLADRKKGKRGGKRLTGIVAVVHGNRLFHLIERELLTAVPKVNAGAILEKALRDLGSDPNTLMKADLQTMLESGSLAQALEDFGEPGAIVEALGRIRRMLDEMK